MKLTFFLLLLIMPGRLCAQRFTGILLGEETRRPLAYATISSGSITVQSNAAGIFTLTGINLSDSIRINCVGYSYYAFKPAGMIKKDTLIIYLPLRVYNLKQVNIKSTRNFKADSLRNRNEFAKVYAYKAPTLAGVMTTVNPYKDIPDDHLTARNSTASLVGFDVLRLVGFLSKKVDKTTQLQKTLLKAESDNYVSQRFNKEKVMAITNLKGDSLQTFTDRYRPTIKQAKKLKDYELVLYIKKCYAEFSTPPNLPNGQKQKY